MLNLLRMRAPLSLRICDDITAAERSGDMSMACCGRRETRTEKALRPDGRETLRVPPAVPGPLAASLSNSEMKSAQDGIFSTMCAETEFILMARPSAPLPIRTASRFMNSMVPASPNDHTDGQTIDHFMKNLQMLVHMANLLADLQRTAQMGSKPFQYCELVRCCG